MEERARTDIFRFRVVLEKYSAQELANLGPNNAPKERKRKKKKGIHYSRANPVVNLPKLYWAERIAEVRVDAVTHELMFLVKWWGYDSRVNTWQRMNDLHDCDELFDHFHRQQFARHHSLITDQLFARLQRSLARCLSADADVCVLLRVSGVTVAQWNRSSKALEAMKARVRGFHSCMAVMRRKEGFWGKRIVAQHVVNELQIEPQFDSLRKFLAFCEKRIDAIGLLKEYEHRLNSQSECRISVENHVDCEVPPEVTEMRDFSLHPDVSVGVSQLTHTVCACKGNCGGNRSCVCALRLRTATKLFKSSYVVYECNEECACDNTCPNRRVQQGRKYALVIFRTEDGRGWGVMAGERIPFRAFIMEYLGEVMDSRAIKQHIDGQYLYAIDPEFGGKTLFVDGNARGNVTRFANHSCAPNMDSHMAVTRPQQALPRIAFFANRKIRAYEELTYDYGRKTLSRMRNGDYQDSGFSSADSSVSGSSSGRKANDVLRIPCLCGARDCKRFI